MKETTRIDAGNRQINISIDQPDGEDYPSSHRITSELKDNIQCLIKHRAKRKHPYVRFQTIMQKDGWKVIKEILNFAAEVGADGINLVRLDTRWSDLERPTWNEERVIIRRARNMCLKNGLRFECIYDQGLATKLASRFDSYCLLLDNFIYITVDGDVVPCCYLLNYSFGNLRKMSLKEIWHNQSFRVLRQKGQVKECHSCDILKYHYSPFQEQKKKNIVLQHKLI